MDYSKFSDDTLNKIANNEPLDYSKLTDDELNEIAKGGSQQPPAMAASDESLGVPSKTESALRGAADYASFGFADEIAGGLEALLSDKTYEQARDESREAYKKAAEENPITYHGAGIASSALIPIGAVGGMATKGAGILSKLGRSAVAGAGMGALAGAGTSEAEDMSGVAKDVATGATAGAILGPVVEGSISALGKVGKSAYENIGPIKAIADTFKYGKAGERIVGESGGEITTKKALESAENVIKNIKDTSEVKNQAFRSAEKISKVQTDAQEIQTLIDKAIAAGTDKKTVKKLQDKLDSITGKVETVITDPKKLSEKISDEISQAADDLRAKTIEKLENDKIRRADLAAKKAEKDAEKMNKDLVTARLQRMTTQTELPGTTQKKFKEEAIQYLKDSGQYIDPEQAAIEARDKVMSEAFETYSGAEIKQHPIVDKEIIETQIAKGKKVYSPMPVGTGEKELPKSAIPSAINANETAAGIQINKLADLNAAQAEKIAERENNKAINDLIKKYDNEKISRTREDIIQELKQSNMWSDPISKAKAAKEATLSGEIDRPLIDIISKFDQQSGRFMISSKRGEDTILNKILPKYEFKETTLTKDKLLPEDLNTLKQVASELDTGIYGQTSASLNELKDQVNKLYKTSISKESNAPLIKSEKELTKLDEPYRVDANLRNALAKLNMTGDFSKSTLGIEDLTRLSEELLKKMTRASETKGSIEYKQTKDAMKSLLDVFPDKTSTQYKNLEQSFKQLEEDAYKTFLSDITRGHNTFAISPGNLNWTMTAAGKLGFAAEAAGHAYRNIANSKPAELAALATKMIKKGHQKYAETLNKIAQTEDMNKRRALTFTLLQNPDFRNAIGGGDEGD